MVIEKAQSLFPRELRKAQSHTSSSAVRKEAGKSGLEAGGLGQGRDGWAAEPKLRRVTSAGVETCREMDTIAERAGTDVTLEKEREDEEDAFSSSNSYLLVIGEGRELHVQVAPSATVFHPILTFLCSLPFSAVSSILCPAYPTYPMLYIYHMHISIIGIHLP